jgi:hypothetical protein
MVLTSNYRPLRVLAKPSLVRQSVLVLFVPIGSYDWQVGGQYSIKKKVDVGNGVNVHWIEISFLLISVATTRLAIMQHRRVVLHFGHRLNATIAQTPVPRTISYKNHVMHRLDPGGAWQWHYCDPTQACKQPSCKRPVAIIRPTCADDDAISRNHNPSFRSVSIMGSRLGLDFNQLPHKFVSIISRFSSSNYTQAPLLSDRVHRRVFNRNHLYQRRRTLKQRPSSRRLVSALASSYHIYRLFSPNHVALANPLELQPWSSTIQQITARYHS